MTEQEIFISICIPAYKRSDFVKRLLSSIAIQTFKNFEVIVSDDTPGHEVRQIVETFSSELSPIIYHKNPQPLGTPANWNKAISLSRGKWIKIMHDDDWFSGPDSLVKFADAAKKETSALLFASYYDVFLSTGKQKRIIPPAFRFRMLMKEPAILISRNIIGPPSVIMHRNDRLHFYDTGLKWLVDIDMYVRRLKDEKIVYLPEPLVKVGIGSTQVTASVHGAAEVEVPEYFHFLQKTGVEKLRNVLVYDAWWRFIRNFQLFSKEAIQRYGYTGTIPHVILKMISLQQRLPLALLKNGIFSKTAMFFHFLWNRKKISG